MGWVERSARNLLPLSLERRSLEIALREWFYSGDMYDLEEPIESCELCDHPNIRYQFKITNSFNGNELLVGSECINKFGIAALNEQGQILDKDDSRRKVNKDRRYLVDQGRRKKLINALLELARCESDFDIESFIGYVQNRGAFTPNQLATLFWRLDKYGVIYNPLDFKLIIRRKREKEQLLEMANWKLEKLWRAMSPSQQRWYKENKWS